MSSSWEASYRKLAALDEVPPGVERKFRAAGATVILKRDGDGVTAIDANSKNALAVRIENGMIWVCVEACEP